LNILFVADVSISEVLGGAERVLYEQTTRLAQRGHNIFLITRKLPNHDKDHEIINGVNEWRHFCNKKNPLKFICSTWINSKRLFESLHQNVHFDCINFHQPFSAIGVTNSALSAQIPKIYTCHSLSFEEFLSRNMNGNGIFHKAILFFQRQARKKIEKCGLNKSDAIVVLSKFTEEKLVETYDIPHQKIETIVGGVDLKRFHPANNRTTIRKQLNIPNDKVVLFTVRNLVQRMGLENLILALQEIKKVATDIWLVVGGEGPLKNRLITQTKSIGLEKEIQFRGFISEEQLPLYYQMADLFILPTEELEGFGLVTLEALASGLPALGTPVGGTKEILGKFHSNFLFKGTDPCSIAELITDKYYQIKHNPEKWQEISHLCRKFVENEYSWDKNIKALEEIFVKTMQN
jgi:glycosyltransferase involved in cell wall biosynthesis